MTWNNLHPQSFIHILSTDLYGIEELKSWLKSNHILYHCYLLKPNDETVRILEEIVKSQGISMDDFFGISAGDNEWIKENIGLIKQPIIVKRNNVSILSPKSTKMIEFVQIGFDIKELENKVTL